VFNILDFAKTHEFYAKFYQHMKDLIELTKNISSRKYNSVEVLRSIDAVMEAKPSGLTRLLYERAFFPDAPPLLTQQQPEGPLNTRDYFFYGSKAH